MMLVERQKYLSNFNMQMMEDYVRTFACIMAKIEHASCKSTSNLCSCIFVKVGLLNSVYAEYS